MKYCSECGTKLYKKYLEGEGDIPYCPTCKQYRFPLYNCAVSMIVEKDNKILLIKQYGRDQYILVAGYINKGEEPKETCKRELYEELGITEVEKIEFNESHYFAKSNTLMINFHIVIKDEELHPNNEIDQYSWFSHEEAKKNIKENSLAQRFLYEYLNKFE